MKQLKIVCYSTGNNGAIIIQFTIYSFLVEYKQFRNIYHTSGFTINHKENLLMEYANHTLWSKFTPIVCNTVHAMQLVSFHINMSKSLGTWIGQGTVDCGLWTVDSGPSTDGQPRHNGTASAQR